MEHESVDAEEPFAGETTAERISREWDAALAHNDAEALVALYAPDAVLESPLIPYLLGKAEGMCQGRDELKLFFQLVARRKPGLRQYYRRGFFTDGRTLMFEYPRAAPQGEQMDVVEVMELREGFIQYHRVYWGWRGVEVLLRDEYR
jgi:hypothetical protein